MYRTHLSYSWALVTPCRTNSAYLITIADFEFLFGLSHFRSSVLKCLSEIFKCHLRPALRAVASSTVPCQREECKGNYEALVFSSSYFVLYYVLPKCPKVTFYALGVVSYLYNNDII